MSEARRRAVFMEYRFGLLKKAYSAIVCGVLVEARLLSRLSPGQLGFEISRQMERTTHRIRTDFRYYPLAERGYAIFSYVQSGAIRSIIAQMRPGSPKRGRRGAAGAI